jgi:hypothetical protein
MQVGRRPKEGEHALKLRGYKLRLFHKSQTRIASPAERKDNFAKVQEQAAKREAKAQPRNPQPELKSIYQCRQGPSAMAAPFSRRPMHESFEFRSGRRHQRNQSVAVCESREQNGRCK